MLRQAKNGTAVGASGRDRPGSFKMLPAAHLMVLSADDAHRHPEGERRDELRSAGGNIDIIGPFPHGSRGFLDGWHTGGNRGDGAEHVPASQDRLHALRRIRD